MKKLLQILISLLIPFVASAQIVIGDMTFYPNWDENGYYDGTYYLSEYTGTESVVTVPETVTSYGATYTVSKISYAFHDNEYITEVILPPSIKRIGMSAFFNCKNLHKINLPEGLLAIDDNAFFNCAFEEIDLPSSLQKLGQSSFSGCRKLTSIAIPSLIKKIEKYAFSGCVSIHNVVLNQGLEEIGESTFNQTQITSLDFPSSLKKIGEQAFANSNISEIKIPENIDKIEDKCFDGSSLKSVIIEKGNSPLTLGEYCFGENYSYISYLSISRDLLIENNKFGNYSNLNSIVLGENMSNLSWFTPSTLYNLNQIVSNAPTPPHLGQFTPEQYSSINVYVPAEYKSNYENDQNWAFFSNIVGLEIPYTDYNISVEPSEITINVGEQIEITPSVDPFISSNINMNVNDPNGPVSFIRFGNVCGNFAGEGDIVCTLMLNNKKAVCHVTVIQPATSILLNKKDITLQKGESVTILANVGPVDVSDPTVTWTSTNSAVATVENGLVTAVGGGECDIVATTHNGLEARCHVSVPVSPESISFEAAEVTVLLGDKMTLTPIISPEDVTEKALTWATSDANVATVEDGVVTCVGLGEATITATTVNNLTAECKVIVNPILAETITLDQTEVEVPIGETFTLTATISPDNTTDKTITWSSSDPEVATVEDGVVSCVGIGDAIITASTSNGLTANCTVKVQMILVESIQIDPSEVVAEQGDKVQLTAIVMPENATNKNIEWTSDNEFVARVDENGLVTIIAKKVTTIHAKATDGSGVEGTCEVTGIAGVESLLIDGKQWNVFTPDGVLIRQNVTIEDIRQLAPAIYIISDGTRTLKLVR